MTGKREFVRFKTFGGEWRTIYKDEDPSGYFLMKSGPHAPMHGLDGLERGRNLDDDFDHTQTYDDGY